MGFFYSFTETLLHSFWQTGLLLLVYAGVVAMFPNIHPLQKRNALYSLLAIQLLLSAVTYTLFAYNTALFSISGLLRTGTADLINAYAPYIFIAWFVVAASRSVLLVSHWIGFKKQLSDTFIKPSVDLRLFTEMRRHHIGIQRSVTLWYSNHIASPITYGFFKPVILLPFSLVNDISLAEAEAIIMHELAHIKNKDYLLNWLLVATEIIYFFNPFIRIIAQRIKLEREKNCDVQVMEFDYAAINYAQVLLRIARRKSAVRSFQMAAARGSSQLLQRIRFFSVDENLYFNRIRASVIALPAAVLLLLAAAFFLPQQKIQQPAGPLAFNFALPVKAENNINFSTAALDDKEISDASASPEIISSSPAVPEEYAMTEPQTPNRQTANVTDFDDPNMVMMPVVMQAVMDSVKEFTYRVETQKGTVTQTFKLTMVKGQWVFEPMWMITVKNADSLNRYMVIDSIQ